MVSYRNKVTYFSFALSLLIVVRHAVNIDIYGLNSGFFFYLQTFLMDLTDICVPTFFMMSGYLFFQNYDKTLLLKKWHSRLFSILIPYLIWNAIAYLYYQVICIVPFVRDSLSDTIEPFSLLNMVKAILTGYHNSTWFLQNLMVYILIVPFLFPILKNKVGGLILLFGVFVLSIFENNDYGYAHNVIFYLTGALFGIHQRELVQQCYPKHTVILAGVIFLLSVLLNTGLQFMTLTLRVPLRVIQAILLWIAADFLAVEKTPAWWMSISFIVYLAHRILLESVEKVILIILGNNLLSAVIDLIIAPVITVLLIILFSSICRRIKPIWKILTGNRGS